MHTTAPMNASSTRATIVPAPQNKTTEEEEAGEEEQKAIQAELMGLVHFPLVWRSPVGDWRAASWASSGELSSSRITPRLARPSHCACGGEPDCITGRGEAENKGFKEPCQQMIVWTINQKRQLKQKFSKRSGWRNVEEVVTMSKWRHGFLHRCDVAFLL